MKVTAVIAAAVFCVVSTSTLWAEEAHEHKGHSHGGEAISKDLGTTTIAGIKVSITQEVVLEAGKEAAFDLIVAKGEKTPKGIRTWYGVSSAEGSVKTKADAEDGGHFHCHVEVPKSIPAGSRYWVEVEPATGKKEKTAFDVATK